MKFEFKLTGTSPLLMHADDVEKSDALQEWRKNSDNKDVSVRGDDRSPAWTWQTYLYSDSGYIVLPIDNLSASLLAAGAGMTLKGTKTFKEASQTAILFHDDFLPVITPVGKVKVADIDAIQQLSFAEQSAAVKDLGLSLFVKRATVGSAKHVRVRPRFDEWSVSGVVEIISQEMNESNLRKLFDDAGFKKGIGDWRPGSPKRPGRFGRFSAELKKI